jgi:hypothetical protein
MSPNVHMPDPQHVYLDALRQELDRLLEAREIDADDYAYIVNNAPESVVFTGSDLEGYDPEEAYDMVMAVGTRDLDNKIRYYEHALRRLATADEE